MSVCQCCGHPIISEDPIVSALTPLQRRIFNIVKSAGVAGISASVILERVYADDINGGPDSSNVISVVVNQMNRRLAQFNLKIKGRGGPGSVFTIQQVAA